MSHFFCCFCLKRPSLICLFHFTKRWISISILFFICCCCSLSLSLFPSLSVSISFSYFSLFSSLFPLSLFLSMSLLIFTIDNMQPVYNIPKLSLLSRSLFFSLSLSLAHFLPLLLHLMQIYGRLVVLTM